MAGDGRPRSSLTYRFVDILASVGSGPYTPADMVDGTPTQVAHRLAALDGAVGRGPSRPPASPPRLLDRVRTALRARHYSRRTEDAYEPLDGQREDVDRVKHTSQQRGCRRSAMQ
jgi:hypothetical protein